MAQINIKVDDELKESVSKIFVEMGLDLTTGIKIYLKRVQHDKKIPFEVKSNAPSRAEKLAAEYQKGNPEVVNSLNELFKTLNSRDSGINGIGEGILNQHSSHVEPTNGIGKSILNNR